MSCLEPLLDVDEPIVVLVFDFIGVGLLNFLIQVDDESLKQEIFLLEVSIFGHGVSTVGKNVLLLQRWILYEVNVSR